MRYFYLATLITMLLLCGCVSSRKHLQRGQYDWAINKSVKKLLKNRSNEKEILVLEQAYRKAMEQDREKLDFLSKEGNPDRWDAVYSTYAGMKARQSNVKRLNLPLRIRSTGRLVNFTFVNYDEEIVEAKKKAAEYFYAKGVALLSKGGRQNARNAYSEFSRVKAFYSDYKDIDEQLRKALDEGTAHVLFKIQNKSGKVIPKDFENEMLKISLYDLNRQWLNFHQETGKNYTYDYTIVANIKLLDVSPEAVKENNYVETKEVQDGFTYALDKKGNVMKDTAGNDIKLPKYKLLKATVTEVYQRKAATIGGTLDFINNATGQLMYTEPIRTETVFEHHAAKAAGDLEALTPESKAKLGRSPLPFPADHQMIMQCAEALKNTSKVIIDSRRGYFQ